jgi:hypothetical protein
MTWRHKESVNGIYYLGPDCGETIGAKHLQSAMGSFSGLSTQYSTTGFTTKSGLICPFLYEGFEPTKSTNNRMDVSCCAT